MDDLIPILAIFFGLGVPALSLATHFVLRPLVKDIVEALRTGPADEAVQLRQRVDELQEELARQQAQLQVLSDAESFRRRLEGE